MVNDANKPSIFLDRDGVVVKTHIRAKKPFAVNNINDFVILPGVKEAIKELKRLGFLVIIVTNQPDISKGLIKIATINKMHEMLSKLEYKYKNGNHSTRGLKKLQEALAILKKKHNSF